MLSYKFIKSYYKANLEYLDTLDFTEEIQKYTTIEQVINECRNKYENNTLPQFLDGCLFNYLTTDEIAEYFQKRYNLYIYEEIIHYYQTRENQIN